LELGFEMKANLTEITEQKNLDGEYCGACHNDKEAFGHTESNCDRCHQDDTDPLRRLEAVRQFRKMKSLPTTPFGNRIDWVQAWELEKIKPSYSLLDDTYEPPAPEKALELVSGSSSTPPTPFDHGKHQQWLDCENCHPVPFNLEQKTVEHFEMKYLLEGKFCGVCHMKVAFPLDDCERCHPGITP
jgi:c(7)-type cytochrome triheme protein